MANTEAYLSKHLHTRAALRGIPVSATFELTSRCNFQCKMCYVHLSESEQKNRGKEFTKEEWIQIARQAKEAGVVFLLLTGGEPFLRSDFVEIYRELTQMGFLISINSNGSLIRGEVLEELRRNPPVRVNVTLYGGSDETYVKLCGVPMFDQVLENIDRLKNAGISVRLNVSLTPYNCIDVERIFQIADEKGLLVRYSSYMNPPVRVDKTAIGTERHRFSPEKAAEYTVTMEKLYYPREIFCKRAEGIMTGIRTEEEDECYGTVGDKMMCRAGRSSLWITWDGRMLPCGMFSNQGVSIREHGFNKAWEITKSETAKIRMPASCSSCSKRSVCSVCAAMCQSETGEFHKKPEYICRMTESLIDNYKNVYKMYKGDKNEN